MYIGRALLPKDLGELLLRLKEKYSIASEELEELAVKIFDYGRQRHDEGVLVGLHRAGKLTSGALEREIEEVEMHILAEEELHSKDCR